MLFRSIRFFLTGITKERKYDVIFFYPSHFNREGKGQNLLFEAFYRSCRKEGLRYLVLEEPTFDETEIRNSDAVPFDFIFLLIVLMRKIFPEGRFNHFSAREWHIAALLRPFFFQKFHFDNVVVLSNSMVAFFRGLNKEARIYDYQHGIIYPFHPGYVNEDGSVSGLVQRNRVDILIYGRNFLNLLLKRENEPYYRRHAHVIGFTKDQYLRVSSNERRAETRSRTILFTSTIVDDSPDNHMAHIETIGKFFRNNSDFFLRNDITVQFKLHPRHDSRLDINEILALPFVRLSEGDIIEALKNSFLHMTLVSTSTFEASALKIPTLLWNTFYDDIGKIFIDLFHYPLGIRETEEITGSIEKYLNDREKWSQDGEKAYAWYKTFYEPYNEQKFISLLRRDKLKSRNEF